MRVRSKVERREIMEVETGGTEVKGCAEGWGRDARKRLI